MSKGSIRSPRKESSQDAVTEPLEVPLRALLGRRGRDQVRIAVNEPLEALLGARLGRQGRDQVTSPNQIKPLHVIANEKLKRFFFALVQR